MGRRFSIKLLQEAVFDAIFLGRATVDFNPIQTNTPLNACTSFQMYLGGSTVNSAIGLARLKHNVSFLGKVANDQFGTFILERLLAEKIDTFHLKKDTSNTRVGLTFTEMLAEQSSILMYRTNVADLTLHPDDFDLGYLQKGKILFISGTALAQEPSRSATIKAALLAKQIQQLVVFDVDYRPYNWADLATTKLYYALLASYSGILIGSVEELNLTLLNLNHQIYDPIALGKKCLQTFGCEYVVVKNGALGSYLLSQQGYGYQVGIVPVKVSKSFGGGDAYNASLLSGILSKALVEQTLLYASCAAGLVVQDHSCSNLPTQEIIDQFITQHKLQTHDLVGEIKLC